MAEGAASSPFGGFIAEAQAGSLSLRMEPEDFARIDHECQAFQQVIRTIQTTTTEISQIKTWGFGDHSGTNLTSAPIMAARFREKSRGSDNSFHAVLELHYARVEEIRQLHEVIRQRFVAADEEWAARYNAEIAALEQTGAK
ncbi:hypothetical protein [Nocardia thailandica]